MLVNTYYIHISAPIYPLKTVRKTCILIWYQQLKTLSVQNGKEKKIYQHIIILVLLHQDIIICSKHWLAIKQHRLVHSC